MGQQLPSARAAMKRAGPALLGIVLGLLVIANARPTGKESDTLDKSYVKFFNLEELIKKINIKRFREFQKSSEDIDNTIPAIDLTQYAVATKTEEVTDALDGQSNKFFISEESVNAARKYGYKILLKKMSLKRRQLQQKSKKPPKQLKTTQL